jgi:hypothetical protein
MASSGSFRKVELRGRATTHERVAGRDRVAEKIVNRPLKSVYTCTGQEHRMRFRVRWSFRPNSLASHSLANFLLRRGDSGNAITRRAD